MDWTLWGLDALARETLLFAGFGFLVGGLDDLLVDGVYLVRRLFGRDRPTRLSELGGPSSRLALFVPVWDEASVIGPMLDAALRRLEHPDFAIFVGAYPNDPGTIAAVAEVAARDPRVRLVIGPRPGPTTKGDNLNALWSALLADDERRGLRTRAVVLHDAEDMVHPAELRVFDALLDRHAVVQLPVRPLIRREHRLVSGVYADEFAESHGKSLVVRGAVGAGLPLAGVGCAIRCDALAALGVARNGAPFDAESLTEDYEMGLHLARLGWSGCFARVGDDRDGSAVATAAYFPDTVGAAVRQKARWIAGIALAGWDRTGWGRPLALADHWMRARDRRAPLAMLVLATAHIALVLWALNVGAHWLAEAPGAPLGPLLERVLQVNAGLLCWRLVVRVVFTARAYGWREGLWAAPRLLVGNVITILAVRRALGRYVGMLRGRELRWEKTAHRFPTREAEAG